MNKVFLFFLFFTLYAVYFEYTESNDCFIHHKNKINHLLYFEQRQILWRKSLIAAFIAFILLYFLHEDKSILKETSSVIITKMFILFFAFYSVWYINNDMYYQVLKEANKVIKHKTKRKKVT